MSSWSLFYQPAVMIPVTIAAFGVVLPYATVYWLWTRRIFTTRTRAIWTAVIVFANILGALAAIVTYLVTRPEPQPPSDKPPGSFRRGLNGAFRVIDAVDDVLP